MKKIQIILMVSILFIGILPSLGLEAKAAEQVTDGGFSYKLTADGQGVIITGYNDSSLTPTIPNEIEGKPVVEIGEAAFMQSEITGIILPDSVTIIGEGAFMQSKITEIILPDNVTTIGGAAFMQSSITEITLPNSVKTIGEAAFMQSKITEIILPDNVTTIGNYAFALINGLKSIKLSKNLVSIGNAAFDEAIELKHIDIPNSVTRIGNYAFRGMTELTHIDIPKNVKYLGKHAFKGATSLKSIKFHTPATDLGENVFENVPDGLKVTGFKGSRVERYVKEGNSATPGKYIFEGLEYEITAKDFDRKVTADGQGIIITGYNDNTSLKPIIPSEIDGKPVVEIGDEVFKESEITEITIPDSVTSIGDSAFYGAIGLTNIKLPDSVTSIGAYAFSEVTGITSIEIPNSVTNIGAYAFSGATGLTSIEIPNGVTSIEESTFERATGLTSITIPDSVTAIGAYAFYKATGLTNIEIPNSLTRIERATFEGATGLTSIEIPNGVTYIGDSAFSGMTGITEIEIPNRVESIGDEAFSGMTGITTITLPESLKSIGDLAFESVTGIKSIEIPYSVESIGDEAFHGATSLKIIKFNTPSIYMGEDIFYDIPDGLKVIGFKDSRLEKYINDSNEESAGRFIFEGSDYKLRDSDFRYELTEDKEGAIITGYNDSVLSNPIIPSTFEGKPVVEIGESAFYDSEITEIIIPNTVKRIGKSAFEEARSLIRIEIPNGVEIIEDFTFANTRSLTSITIPNKVKSIGEGAFEDARSLTNVEIPNGVESIGNFAFRDTRSLTSITIPNRVKSIGEGAFEDAKILTSIEIPNSVATIGDYAFEDMSALKTIKFHNPLTTLGNDIFKEVPKGLKVIGFKNTKLEAYIKASNDVSPARFIFEALSYNVTFNSMEGTEVAAVNVDFGKVITEPKAPTKANHVFEGWYTDKDHKTKWDFNKVVEKELTLYAKWSIIKNKVTFDSMEGTEVAAVNVDFGKVITQPKAPTKKNHRFEGWYTDAKYKTKWDFKTAVEKDLTLYAKWSINKQVTFESDGGTKIASVYAGYKKPITEPKAPTKKNHVFEGWYTDKDHKTKWDFKTAVEKELTLYAKWSIIKNKVTFDSMEGTEVAAVNVDFGKVITQPKAPTKKNHRFEGWYTDAKYKTKWDFNKVVEKELTLYAKWSINKQVTFESDGGTKIASVYAGYKKPITEPKAPTKKNHVFEGWYTDKDHKTKWDFNKVVEKDLTLYAKWTFVAPAITLKNPTNISDVTVQVKGTTSPNSTVRIVQGSKKIGEGKSDTKGNFAIKISKVKASSTVEIQVTDAYGNKKSFKKTVADKTAPKVTLSSISDKQDTITGKTEAKVKVKIYVSNKHVKTVTTNSKGNYSYKVGKKKAGTAIKVIATDQAGNATTETVKVLDKTAPKVTLSSISDKQDTITGKTEAKVKVKIYVSNKHVKTVTANSKGDFSYKVGKKKAGTSIKLIATDQAGNATTKTVKVLDKTAPAKPSVKSVKASSTTVVGKAEAKSTVYVYKGKTYLGKATTSSKGNYTVKIKKQKKGTTLLVKARDKAKNTSKNTSIKVK